jgi:hypothetical protein
MGAFLQVGGDWKARRVQVHGLSLVYLEAAHKARREWCKTKIKPNDCQIFAIQTGWMARQIAMNTPKELMHGRRADYDIA